MRVAYQRYNATTARTSSPATIDPSAVVSLRCGGGNILEVIEFPGSGSDTDTEPTEEPKDHETDIG